MDNEDLIVNGQERGRAAFDPNTIHDDDVVTIRGGFISVDGMKSYDDLLDYIEGTGLFEIS